MQLLDASLPSVKEDSDYPQPQRPRLCVRIISRSSNITPDVEPSALQRKTISAPRPKMIFMPRKSSTPTQNSRLNRCWLFLTLERKSKCAQTHNRCLKNTLASEQQSRRQVRNCSSRQEVLRHRRDRRAFDATRKSERSRRWKKCSLMKKQQSRRLVRKCFSHRTNLHRRPSKLILRAPAPINPCRAVFVLC